MGKSNTKKDELEIVSEAKDRKDGGKDVTFKTYSFSEDRFTQTRTEHRK